MPQYLSDVVKGFGTLETVIDSLGEDKFVYTRPKVVADETKEAFYSTDITINSQVQNITSKNKAESLYKALEIFLGSQPFYDNFITKFCFPSYSQETKQSKYQMKKLEDLYFFERYFAANCNNFFASSGLTLGPNIFGELRSRRCKDEPDVFAYRICKALIHSGLDSEKLRRKYKDNFQHAFSADIVLSRGIKAAIEKDRIDEVLRFCNEKLQNFFVQM